MDGLDNRYWLPRSGHGEEFTRTDLYLNAFVNTAEAVLIQGLICYRAHFSMGGSHIR